MHITAIQLSGFKSFAEPTTLPIASGLTVIVGPNGCGKSNIIEAVRWVMGESSAKRLRGEGMDDVIFAGAGAGARSRRRSASVAVHLDNAEGLAPAPFQDAPELIVSRTIERNAGSTYRINNQEVRARDVQLLFADLSIGSRSASIISQGEIADLVDSQPEARRLLLEEAAGIRGLQTRRHEAELKLRQAEENLLRLEDVIQKSEANVLMLERQAHTTEKFRALKVEQRHYEALDWYLQDQQLAREYDDLWAQCQHAEQEQAEAGLAQAVEAKKQAALAQQIIDARYCDEQNLLALQASQEATHTAQRAWEQDALSQKNLAEQVTGWQDDCQHERTQQQQAQKHLQDISAELSQAKADQALADDTSDGGQEELSAQVSATREALAQTAQRLQKHRDAQQAWMQQQQELRATVRAVEQQLDKLAKQQRALVVPEKPEMLENQDDEDRLDTFEHDLAMRQERSKQSRLQMQKAYDSWQQQRNQREAVDQAEQQWRIARQQHQHSREECERLEGEWHSCQQVLNQESTQEITPEAISEMSPTARLMDLWVIPPMWQKVIGAVLEKTLRASLNAEAAIYQAADQACAQSSAPDWPHGVTSLAQALGQEKVTLPTLWQQILSWRLDYIGLCDDLEAVAFPTLSLSPGQILVDRAGNIAYWHGLRVAYQPAQDQQARAVELRYRLQQQREALPMLAKKSQTAEQHYTRVHTDWQQAVTAAETAYQAAEKQNQDDIQALSALEQEKLAWQEQHQASLKAWQQYRAQSQAVRHTQDQLEAQQASLQQEYDALQQKQHILAQQINAADLGTHITVAEQKQSAQQQQLELVQAELLAHRASKKAAAQQYQRLQAEAERLEHTLKTHMRRADELTQRIRDWEVRQPEREQHTRRLKLVLEQSQQVKQQSERERQDSAADLQRLLAEEVEHARQLHTADMRLAQRQQSVHRLQTAIQVKQQQRESLHQAAVSALSSLIHGDLGHSLGHDLQKLPEYFDFTDTQRSLTLEQVKVQRAGLERKILALGEVNLRADIDAAEQRQQLESMRHERADLQQGISELREAISTLNIQGHARLKQSFAQMNSFFAEYFHQLFSGGDAHLQWLESDDPIAPGIDIRARPPGKARQSVHLLSGGEKALTALALIAAVMRLTPTPICLLDEVDAALDDANVERFCQLLRDMTNQGVHTRFVVISHHRLSMAKADRLLGIGMPERGISRLYAVDLLASERSLSA